MDDARKCILLKPHWSKGYYRMAYALLSLQQPWEAYGVLATGVRMAPHSRVLRRMRRNLREVSIYIDHVLVDIFISCIIYNKYYMDS